jgi:hypothetical protein
MGALFPLSSTISTVRACAKFTFFAPDHELHELHPGPLPGWSSAKPALFATKRAAPGALAL